MGGLKGPRSTRCSSCSPPERRPPNLQSPRRWRKTIQRRPAAGRGAWSWRGCAQCDGESGGESGGENRAEREADRIAATADAPTVATVSARPTGGVPSPALQTHLQQRAGGGGPLPDVVRQRLEPRLGTDLSEVRVHHDGAAHRMATEVGATAFAYGPDIYFRRGAYEPHSTTGRRTLAHEVVHTVQQRDAAPAIQRQDGPHDRLSSDQRRMLRSLGMSPSSIPRSQHRQLAAALTAIQGIAQSLEGGPPYSPSEGIAYQAGVDYENNKGWVHVEGEGFTAVLRTLDGDSYFAFQVEGGQRLTGRAEEPSSPRRELEIVLEPGSGTTGRSGDIGSDRRPRSSVGSRNASETGAPSPSVPENSPSGSTSSADLLARAFIRALTDGDEELERPLVSAWNWFSGAVGRIRREATAFEQDVDQRGLVPAIRTRFDEYWPVGAGYRVNLGAGVTFAIPIHVGQQSEFVMDRTSSDVVELTRRYTIVLAADTGFGAGFDFGMSDRVGVHVRGEARAMGGHRVRVIERYAFPIHTDDEFTSFVATLGGSTTQTIAAMAAVLEPDHEGLNPERYLVDRSFGYELFGEANAEGTAGVMAGRRRSRQGVDARGRPTQALDERRGRVMDSWTTGHAGERRGVRDEQGRHVPGPRNRARDGDEHGDVGLPGGAGVLLRLIGGAAAHIGIAAAGGVNVTMIPESQVARRARQEDGEPLPRPDYYDIQFQVAGSVAGDLTIDLPGPLGTALAANPGLGLQITVRVHPSRDGQEMRADNVRFQLVLSQGDIDAATGAASETTTDIDRNALAVVQGRAALPDMFRDIVHRNRMAIAGPQLGIPDWVRRWIDRRLGNHPNLAQGVRVSNFLLNAEGQLDFEIQLEASRLSDLLSTWGERLFEYMRDAGLEATRDQLVLDIMAWIDSGTPPDYLRAAGEEFLAALLNLVTVSRFRVVLDVGFHAHGNLRAAFGAKLRIAADGGLAGRFTVDFLRGRDAVTAGNVASLLRAYLLNGERQLGDLLRSRLPAGLAE
ncbi:MAG: DUF4157 domain-containing protein [Myxococcota bacterium]